MVDLNADGKKLQDELSKSGLSLRDASMSIRDMTDLGLIDREPPMTGAELRTALQNCREDEEPVAWLLNVGWRDAPCFRLSFEGETYGVGNDAFPVYARGRPTT